MKAEIIGNDREGGIVIKLVAETAKESIEILKAANQVIKPIKARGRITEAGVWAWFALPKSKKIDDWDATVIGNYD